MPLLATAVYHCLPLFNSHLCYFAVLKFPYAFQPNQLLAPMSAVPLPIPPLKFGYQLRPFGPFLPLLFFRYFHKINYYRKPVLFYSSRNIGDFEGSKLSRLQSWKISQTSQRFSLSSRISVKSLRPPVFHESVFLRYLFFLYRTQERKISLKIAERFHLKARACINISQTK